jgi:hypothetical protein
VSVGDRGEPQASCWNGTEMARTVRTTLAHIWQRWHQLGRWARPVQGDTSLVGKSPQVARQLHLCRRLRPEELQLDVVGVAKGDQVILDPGMWDAQRSQPLLPLFKLLAPCHFEL